MADKVYKILDLVGSSEVSWEDAARNVSVQLAHVYPLDRSVQHQVRCNKQQYLASI